jgi:DNA-binding NtrC family response regulator
VISATNKDLREASRNGDFREDLYHRLSVILIHVPTLNERQEDIPLLAEHFNILICNEYGMSKKNIKKDAIQELQKIEWTGNIREFRNVLERLIILCKDDITGKDVIAYARPVSGTNI